MQLLTSTAAPPNDVSASRGTDVFGKTKRVQRERERETER